MMAEGPAQAGLSVSGDDLYHWFALRAVPYVGNVTFCRLVSHFGSPREALLAPPEAWRAVPRLPANAIEGLREGKHLRGAEAEADALARANGVRVVTYLDEEFPKPLLQIPDFPPYLYVRGSLEGIQPSIGVVGSRRASSTGISVTERLARELADAGVTVISGMARGVDTAAHRGALKAGGTTVAVLGCGVDVIYPRENARLFEETAENGAVVSECPLGAEPLAENFPRRNRIISGISQGVLVVEAAEKSGSLITAQYALEQGRDVFAVPGSINSPTSRGTNSLIKQGAKLVMGVEDILEELRLPVAGAAGGTAAVPAFSLAPEEAALYTLLAQGPLHIDDIIVNCGLTVGEVSAILLRLELKGAVQQLPGKHFSLP